MTPYQRGNRDGMLAFANELEAQARTWDAESARWTTAADAARDQRSERWDRAADAAKAEAYRLRQVAALCRRRAESLPDDPAEKP